MKARNGGKITYLKISRIWMKKSYILKRTPKNNGVVIRNASW